MYLELKVVFHKTSLRLSGLYLAILMFISLSFSTALYGLSMREFDRGFRRQEELINDIPPTGFFPGNFQRQITLSRQTAAREARSRILGQLILANVAILLFGGGLSYFLARKTLQPIEDAHNSLEQFTADASHELRTPIAAMRSEIEVALMQPKLRTSEVKELLNSNLEELDRLTVLTDNLLAIARHEEKPLELKNQALLGIVEGAVAQLESAAKEKNIVVTVDVDAQIKAIFDQHSLREVLVILLDNAMKYSIKNSSVKIKARTSKESVALSVTDHGIGIKPEDQEHVFKRFYRADTSRAQTTKGHGLGLSIAKQLVERQNGAIELTSKPGKSTTATVILST